MKKLLNIIAVVITAISVVTAGTACILWVYQPRTPKSLMK